MKELTNPIPLWPQNFFLHQFNVEISNAVIEIQERINERCNYFDVDLENNRSPHPLSGYTFLIGCSWINHLFTEDYSYDLKMKFSEFIQDPEIKRFADIIGKVSIVDEQHIYDEDNEQTVYIVYHFEKWNLYLRVHGSYYSHVGATYKGWTKVKPKEKIIRDWIAYD
jgi:hypothetical protein